MDQKSMVYIKSRKPKRFFSFSILLFSVLVTIMLSSTFFPFVVNAATDSSSTTNVNPTINSTTNSTINSTISSSSTYLPPALQKIKDYNLALASSNALKITFVVAFLAGMLGILSPCILPFLPAYFAYTFKEKKNITQMTLIFFLGFSLVFVTMGVIAGYAGEQTLGAIQSPFLTRIAGLFLITMGILLFMGKGFSSFFQFHTKFKRDVLGTFLFGIAFAIGWTACMGPILSGILAIGALLHNIYYAALLLFFYSLGNLVPLFIISFFYDTFNISKKTWLTTEVTFMSKTLPLTSLISSILFTALGLILLIFGGTALFNTLDLLSTKQYFYTVQNAILNYPHASLVGTILLIAFIVITVVVIKRSKKK